MSAPNTCSVCKFSDVAMGAFGPVMECRRYPPTGNPGGLAVEGFGDVSDDFTEAAEVIAEIDFPRWPRVAESDWCGEFAWNPLGA